MRLQTKVTLIVAGILAAICFVALLDSRYILLTSYQWQEEKLAFKDINRVRNVLNNKLQALELYTNSWSQWDDAYHFMEKTNKSFIDSNFVAGTFTSSHINFFLFYNTEGKLYYGKAYDLDKNTFAPIPASLQSYLDSHKNFVIHTTNINYSGLFQIPEGIVIMSSLPVVTSDGKGPIHGTLLMGYYLTPEIVSQIANTVDMRVKFLSIAALHQLHNQINYLDKSDSNMIEGYSLVTDIDNHPLGVLQIDIPRTLYSEGIMTIWHFMIVMVVAGILLITAMWYLLKTIVINRILKVSEKVIEINTEASFQKRINLTGADELNQMAACINSMLELIELTQDQLRYRISQRTKELEKLSALNRNLFGEVGKQKSIETKVKEDEKLLRKMAYYDSLTNLPNRAFFSELLQKAIVQAQHDKNKIAVIFIDADKFKKMNDTYGHDFGDEFLKTTALRLHESIKETDVAARLAGDEFILFLTNVADKDAIDKAVEKIFSNLTAPLTIDNITVNPTFSLGISIYPDDAATFEDLINRADLAMYYAKKKKGNIFYYYGAVENSVSSKELY